MNRLFGPDVDSLWDTNKKKRGNGNTNTNTNSNSASKSIDRTNKVNDIRNSMLRLESTPAVTPGSGLGIILMLVTNW